VGGDVVKRPPRPARRHLARVEIVSRDLVFTKYIPPTNTRGARIAVKQGFTTMRVAWDDAIDVQANHAEAVFAFLREHRADLGAVALEPMLVPESLPYAYAFLIVNTPRRRYR